jgi:hypothetical protein
VHGVAAEAKFHRRLLLAVTGEQALKRLPQSRRKGAAVVVFGGFSDARANQATEVGEQAALPEHGIGRVAVERFHHLQHRAKISQPALRRGGRRRFQEVTHRPNPQFLTRRACNNERRVVIRRAVPAHTGT